MAEEFNIDNNINEKERRECGQSQTRHADKERPPRNKCGYKRKKERKFVL